MNAIANPVCFELHTGATEVGYNDIACEWPIFSMSYKTGSDNNDVTAKQWIHHNTIDAMGGHGIVMASAFGAAGYNERTNGKYTDVDICDNVITNVGGAYQKGIQLEVDGDFGGFEDTQITRNTISSADTPSGSKGIRLLGDVTNTYIANNIITGVYRAVWLTDSWSNGVYPTGTEIEYNSFEGSIYGVDNKDTDPGNETDAEMNWWGDAAGPIVVPKAGVFVSDNVDYDPWIGKLGGENIVCVPDPQYLTSDDPDKLVSVEYLGGGSGAVYGYSIKFTWDGSVASTTTGQVSEGALLSDIGSTTFYATSTGANEITVDCVLLGSTAGALLGGTLFTVEFDAVATGMSAIDVTVIKVRDQYNAPLSGFYEDDGLLIVDNEDPVFTINDPWPDGECYNTAPVLDLEASDDDDLDDAFYRIDGGSWTADAGLFTDYAGASWSNAAWTLPGFAGLSEGSHTVEFYCTDDIGNTSNIPSWDFIKDTVDPPPVSDFAAAPGHEKVKLSWTNPGSDFDHVVVVRKPWVSGSPYGYPDYPQPADGYPTGPTDGTEVYSGTAESYTDSHADRSIYFYRAFAVDCAGNYNGGTAPGGSVPAAFAQGDRSTNYWLGDFDIPYDGYVDYNDLVPFSDAYRSPTVNDTCDIGPTDDYSRLGIPLPDDAVEFEDLIIFAMNFGEVDPTSKTFVAPLLAGVATSSELELSLRVVEITESTLRTSVYLDGNVSEVKGVSAILSYDREALELRGVRDLTGDAAPVFVGYSDDRGTITADMAVLGQNVVIGGSGEIMEVTFDRISDGRASVTLDDADIRGLDNRDIGRASSEEVVVGETPVTYALYQNHPNPFNPVTSVGYSLAEDGYVELNVFNSNGQLVRTLVDGFKTAGSHSVKWDGTDDSGREIGSGIYFYTISTAEFTSTRKMVLMK
jgi:hypothetical protein